MKNSLLYVAEVKLKSFLIMPFKYTPKRYFNFKINNNIIHCII